MRVQRGGSRIQCLESRAGGFAAAPPLRPLSVTSSPSRNGFTLTELLVAMTILLILVAVTVSTVNVSFNNERIRSAARQVQSYLEGARDRAIYAGQDRGVRFLLDQTDQTTVSSMLFIGTTTDWNDGSIEILRRDFVNNATGVLGSDYVPDGMEATVLFGIGTNWDLLLDRGLLVNGAQIQIGGQWYTVSTSLLQRGYQALEITPPYRDAIPMQDAVRYRQIAAGPPTLRGLVSGTVDENEYRLMLQPGVLPNQEPVQLPRGIVVDLDYSELAPGWGNRGGPYSNQMDVMFSPRGTVTGAAAGAGIIHFLLNDVVDTERAYGADGQPGVAGVDDDSDGTDDEPDELGWPGSDDLRPVDIDVNGNGTLEENERNLGDKLIVTLFTRTGHISTHPLFVTEDLNNNGVLDLGEDVNGNGVLDPIGSDPYFYAETGEVAQ